VSWTQIDNASENAASRDHCVPEREVVGDNNAAVLNGAGNKGKK
jgi:hypothetical protein